MYTVKQVVAMTGLSAPTLRAWERRYGVVSPRRTESHYRMFSDQDVARLRAMIQLVDAGAAVHKAAEIVRAAPPGSMGDPLDHETAPTALAEAAAELDVERLATLLQEVLQLDRFESRCDDWLAPAIRHSHDQLRSGALADIHRRCAQTAISHRLTVLLDECPLGAIASDLDARVRPVVLIAQQEAEGSGVLPLVFTIAMRRRGADARLMGRGISEQGWLRAVAQLQPRAVVIAATSPRGQRQLRDLAARLAQVSPPIQVWQAGTHLDPTRPRHLPLELSQAADRVVHHLWGGLDPGATPRQQPRSSEET